MRARIRSITKRPLNEARDGVELFLLPGLAAVLPWRLCFQLFKLLAHCPWLYRAACESAYDECLRLGWGGGERARWMWERRLTTLVDHADMFISWTRPAGWATRAFRASGQWQQPGATGGLLFTFHWGAAFWSLAHARESGLSPQMVIAPVVPEHFSQLWVLHRYVKWRIAAVERTARRPTISARGSMASIRAALARHEQVVVVLDVPADQGHSTAPATLLGRPTHLPNALLQLAQQQALPVTVFSMDFDLRDGQRRVRLVNLPVGGDEPMTSAVYSQLDHLIQERPALWHLWSQSRRFFK